MAASISDCQTTEESMIGLLHRSDDHHSDRVLARIAREVVSFYDWLSGPPMTEQARQNRDLAEAQNTKYITYGGS